MKAWLLIHSGLCLVCGALQIIVPNVFRHLWINGPLDDLHLFVLRAGGIMTVSVAVLMYLNYKCLDKYTGWSILFGMALTGTIEILVITCALLNLTEDTKGKEAEKGPFSQNLKYMLGIEVLVTLVNMFFIFKERDFGVNSQLHSRLNLHLRADFFLKIMHGILLLAFPNVILSFLTNNTAFDVTHLSVLQVIGGVFIGSGTISLLATSFLLSDNKRHVLLCRCLETLCFIVLLIYTQTVSNAFGGSTQMGLTVGGVISVNALMGYYSPHETDLYISKGD